MEVCGPHPNCGISIRFFPSVRAKCFARTLPCTSAARGISLRRNSAPVQRAHAGWRRLGLPTRFGAPSVCGVSRVAGAQVPAGVRVKAGTAGGSAAGRKAHA